LRYDEDLNENKALAEKLYIELKELDIYVFKYVRGLNKNGIWGSKKEYIDILNNLEIPVKVGFPAIYFH
jgi:hypothetical protein